MPLENEIQQQIDAILARNAQNNEQAREKRLEEELALGQKAEELLTDRIWKLAIVGAPEVFFNLAQQIGTTAFTRTARHVDNDPILLDDKSELIGPLMSEAPPGTIEMVKLCLKDNWILPKAIDFCLQLPLAKDEHDQPTFGHILVSSGPTNSITVRRIKDHDSGRLIEAGWPGRPKIVTIPSLLVESANPLTEIRKKFLGKKKHGQKLTDARNMFLEAVLESIPPEVFQTIKTRQGIMHIIQKSEAF
jgi:hypothetical protein